MADWPALGSLLLRVLSPAASASLLLFLSQRDAVCLLATCRTLRCDRELLAFLVSRDPVTSHFFQNCALDWRKFPPSFRWPDAYACSGHDDDATLSWDESNVASHRLASLLSLAGLFADQLQRVAYKQREGYVNQTTAIPFVLLPEASAEATERSLHLTLEALNPGLGDTFSAPEAFVSEPGLHWENLRRESDDNVSCAFCEAARAIDRFREEGQAHWERRGEELERLRGESNTDSEYTEHARELEEAMKEKDLLFDLRMIEESRDEIALYLLDKGLFPRVQLMDTATSHQRTCVSRAVVTEYTRGICPLVYRPMRRFFDENGFTHVRRVRTVLFDGSDELPKNQIASVEMIGGVAPHGFFAGIYLVEVFA